MYKRDKEIIEKLKLHTKGKYNRISLGDVEYIIMSLTLLNTIEAQHGLHDDKNFTERS